MFGDRNFKRIRQTFADQFEPYGDGFVYRRDMRGAPIEVSPAERDRFIAIFDRFIKRSVWLTFSGALLIMACTVAYSVWAKTPVSSVAIYVGLGIILIIYMTDYFWAKNVPSRELKLRSVVGEPRSRIETQRRLLGKITYAQIAGIAAIGAWLAIRNGWEDNFQSAWDWGWVVAGASMVILSAVNALRKWRFESARK